MKAPATVLIPLLLSLMGCEQEEQDQVDSNPATQAESNPANQARPADNTYNLNLSIFLDLSDRISTEVNSNTSMEYFQRDLGYLESISLAFEKHMLYKKLILMNERVQLFVDPLPANSDINEIISELRMSFNRNNTTKERIVSLGSTYAANTARLYELAIQDNNFIGSDIWGFFNTKVSDYCVAENFRNVFVIITDGYVYHQDNLILDENRSNYITPRSIAEFGLTGSDWESVMKENNCGLLVGMKELENLEVLVLGIHANKQSPFEEEVIRKYWGDWLSEMGVRKYAIKSADLPTNLDEIIHNFILNP